MLTDSGGIQEETTILKVPCLTLRENTERPITCEVGSNRLVGTQPEKILAAYREVMSGQGPAAGYPAAVGRQGRASGSRRSWPKDGR